MTAMAALDQRPAGQEGRSFGASLRRVLLWAAAFVAVFLVCFYFAEPIFQFLARPIAEGLASNGLAGNHQRLIFTALTEVFFTYVKVAFFAAAFICFPVFVARLLGRLNAWRGRFGRFGRAVTLAALAIPFVLGGAVAYYVVFPQEMAFWVAFQAPLPENTLPIELEPKIAESLSILMRKIFTFGLIFQLPVVLFLFFGAGRVEEKEADGRA